MLETTERESVSKIYNENNPCGFDKNIRINLSNNLFDSLLIRIVNSVHENVNFVSLKEFTLIIISFKIIFSSFWNNF